MSVLTAPVPVLWFAPMAHEGGRFPCLQSAIITLQSSLRESALKVARLALLASQPSVPSSNPSLCAAFTASSTGWAFLGINPPSSGTPVTWAGRQHQLIKDLSVPRSGLRDSLVAQSPPQVAACPWSPLPVPVPPSNQVCTVWFLQRGEPVPSCSTASSSRPRQRCSTT